jgi:NAD(P)-dependent dehydrogenase (short-subunit alcohol dehydrogenase family)
MFSVGDNNLDNSSIRLDGQRILITGVSRPLGIGATLAKRFAQSGANVAVHGYSGYDLESMFLEDGANQSELWGFNLYPDEDEDFIEFDSMINIRPWQNNISRGVDDLKIQAKIKEVIYKWIK